MKYGFQEHLSSEFPSQINVDATQFCNLACVHCPYSVFAKSNSFSGTHLDPNLNKKMVDEVATDGFKYCKYIRYTSNGEPLLHPQIDEILSYACLNSNTKVTLTTNGTLLTEKRIDRLLNNGLHSIDISIDAFKDETYEKIRIKGNLKKTRSNVLNLINRIKNGSYDTKVVVSFVRQELNFNEADDFEKFWKNEGVDYVIIRKLHSASGSKEEIKNTIKINSKKTYRKPCLYPWERFLLNPLGEISYCPSDWYHKSVIGNIKVNSIKELWKGKTMSNLRKAHLENSFDGFNFCKECPDWVNTKWPFEGRSYSNMMREI